jgi:hypothetical protein
MQWGGSFFGKFVQNDGFCVPYFFLKLFVCYFFVSFFVQHEGDEGQLPHAGTLETFPRTRG